MSMLESWINNIRVEAFMFCFSETCSASMILLLLFDELLSLLIIGLYLDCYCPISNSGLYLGLLSVC